MARNERYHVVNADGIVQHVSPSFTECVRYIANASSLFPVFGLKVVDTQFVADDGV